MTRINLTISHGGTMRWLRINGKLQETNRIARVQNVAPGEWVGETTSGLGFRVFGGKAAGGSKRDWFLYIGQATRPINCVSAVDAFHVLVNS